MLARDGLATGNKINPARSSCAIHVTSYNGNRETIYHQQQTISGSGMTGDAAAAERPKRREVAFRSRVTVLRRGEGSQDRQASEAASSQEGVPEVG